jgi:zeaxanthin epoxidase
MKVALFEQASSYAPYGGPIQIQSNALRAIQNINPDIYEELVKAGTCTADRVSGLKIGYRKGNKLAGLYDAGDWLVRFDTVGPALEAGLPATVVVDRPVIQQILVRHGFPEGTVRIKSRIEKFVDLGKGRGVAATLGDGTMAYADVLVGADGIWSQVRKNLHGLDDGAGGFAASGAAGGALDDAEARRLARDTVDIARKADRRFSGFTCYAALASHRASRACRTRYCWGRRSTSCRPTGVASGSSGSRSYASRRAGSIRSPPRRIRIPSYRDCGGSSRAREAGTATETCGTRSRSS